MNRLLPTSAIALAAVALAACGSSSSSSSPPPDGSGNSGALSAEAKSAATGDIPDNQQFLVFHDKPAGYSIKYPEGWAQTGAGRDVTIRDKNNIVHVVVASASHVTSATVEAELKRERARTPSLKPGAASSVALPAGKAIKVTYTTVSRPNPVTGKRVKLTVDRYVFARGSKQATVDLGTPVGVDNVDAYRLMAQSFRWR